MTYHSKCIIIFEDCTNEGGNAMQATSSPKKRKEYSMLAIDKQLHKEVKAFCASEGVSMISLVEALLRGYMKQRKIKEG